MRLLLTWSLAVSTLLLAGNPLISSPPYGVADPLSPPRRRTCVPDCVCLASGGDDVTRSRGGELCMRSAEVGQLSASRLASVTRLSISGPPAWWSTLLPAAARRLSNVRRLLIVSDGGADVDDWMRLFSAFGRLNRLTIRNSSSTDAAQAALVIGRFLPNLRRLDLSGSGVGAVELRSLQKLRHVEVLDLAGNSLRQLTAANDSGCIDYDQHLATSTSGCSLASELSVVRW